VPSDLPQAARPRASGKATAAKVKRASEVRIIGINPLGRMVEG
jgi:hypothetical protein